MDAIADDIFKCIFLNENVWIPIKISLKFVPKGPISNIPAMVQSVFSKSFLVMGHFICL